MLAYWEALFGEMKMDAWDKPDGRGKIRLARILSIATLLISVAALVLALKKPQPVAPPQTPAAIAANAQSFQAKVSQLEQARDQGQTGSEVRLTADEIGAAIAQAEGASPAPGKAPSSTGPPVDTPAAVTPGWLAMPTISTAIAPGRLTAREHSDVARAHACPQRGSHRCNTVAEAWVQP